MKGDLHAGQQNPGGFDVLPMDEQGDEMMATIGEREIWLGRNHQDNNLLDDVTVAAADCNSFFYSDFPPLPDFPCMSSSSSSSSTPALTKPIATPSASSASSSSSTASWAMFKSDAERPQPQQQQSKGAGEALSSTASMEGGFQPSDGGIMEDHVDCMDVMEDFGYMDLIDWNDIWDPSSILHQNPDEPGEAGEYSNKEEHVTDFMLQGNSCEVVQEKEERLGLDELGVMFFEWLKTNKEHISAEDMRNIKLKRATIECASKRLGSTKEGRKQLLKLILEWVEQYQLQKKRSREEAQEAEAAAASQIPCQYNQEQQPFPNPDPNLLNSVSTDPNTCFSSWTPLPPPPSFVPNPAAVMAVPPPPVFPPVVGFIGGDPYANGTPMNCHPYPPPAEYQMFDSAQSWPLSQFAFNSFPENGNFTPIVPQPQPVQPLDVGDQYNSYQVFNGNGIERLARLGSSATKEARKKRMARQRQSSVYHYRHHHPNPNQHPNDTSEQQKNCTNNAQANPGNWVYWPAAAGGSAGSTVPMLAQPPMDAPPPPQCQPGDPASVQPRSYQRQVQSDRRQQPPPPAYKVEKNLKFLLQKVLKQSDVGNLGRIVLPKKEAETQLPELEARDGMSIAMEDIGTSKVWNMRYSLRFWPNNKSRMYLLENTGEFVKANGLQEGDFIVIYSDIKCGKYLIRGVKVRQPGPKGEGKKPAKRSHRNSSAAAGNGNSSKLNTH